MMISHMGSKVERDDSVSGWLSKPVKPLQLKSLLLNLITPKNDAAKDAEGLPSLSRKRASILLFFWQKITP